ncbi:hypothetical protein ASE60_28910 [Ensifer sp. Root278]|nr:hypothetical protein ASE60_28910 [Ensifer sp. Root278]
MLFSLTLSSLATLNLGHNPQTISTMPLDVGSPPTWLPMHLVSSSLQGAASHLTLEHNSDSTMQKRNGVG